MTPSVESKAQQMLAADFLAAERNMISRNQDGSYDVFGRWHLRDCAGLITVSRQHTVIQKFSSLRSAVSWCIAEKYQQQELAQEIRRLDADLQRLAPTDAVYHYLLQRIRDPDRKIVMMSKSQEAHIKHRFVVERMSRCIARAKYLQIKGFNDEIARTRRPAPHRTSRDGFGKSRRSTN